MARTVLVCTLAVAVSVSCTANDSRERMPTELSMNSNRSGDRGQSIVMRPHSPGEAPGPSRSLDRSDPRMQRLLEAAGSPIELVIADQPLDQDVLAIIVLLEGTTPQVLVDSRFSPRLHSVVTLLVAGARSQDDAIRNEVITLHEGWIATSSARPGKKKRIHGNTSIDPAATARFQQALERARTAEARLVNGRSGKLLNPER